MTESVELPDKLTRQEYAEHAVAAMLLGVPVVGSSLERLIFGPGQHLELRRIERTLREVYEAVKHRSTGTTAEEYGHLFRAIGGDIARATNEDKRQRFRDLLINAITLDSGSTKWEEASLVAEIVSDLPPPALAVIAGIARTSNEKAAVRFLPPAQVHSGPVEAEPVEPSTLLPYHPAVIEESTRRLRDMRLIHTGYHHGDSGFGDVVLSELGLLIVEWAIA